MNHKALQRVTEALRDSLQIALRSANVPGNVFIGPLDDADASGSPLILFLYRIVPSASLRNREHRVLAAAPARVHVFRNSLPLDLHYLITVGTVAGSEESLLLALGLAMQSLQHKPDLTGPELEFETVRVTLEPMSTEEVSRIWALFPTANYRTSVAYVASPVWIDPAEPERTGVPVVEDTLLAASTSAEVAR